MVRVEAAGPGLGGEGWIGDGEVEGLEAAVPVLEVRGGQRVAAPQIRGRVTVQEHVHTRQRPGGVVHLLTVDGDAARRLVGDLEQQGPGTTSRIVDGLSGAGFRADANHLRHDAGDLGRGVKLPLALARLGGEVPHQVLVGVAQEVVALGPVGAQVKAFEDGDQLREPILHLLARPELALVVEIRLIDDPLELIGLGEPTDNRVDLVANLLVALELRHVGEATPFGHLDERIRLAGILVRDVLHEQQGQDVVLVLRGVHAAAKLVAALPERGVELGFLQGHLPCLALRERMRRRGYTGNCGREPSVVREPPSGRVHIERRLYRLRLFQRSSGTAGPTMSPTTVTVPLNSICGYALPARLAGPSSATGRPRFRMTTRSPVADTRSRISRHRAWKSDALMVSTWPVFRSCPFVSISGAVTPLRPGPHVRVASRRN